MYALVLVATTIPVALAQDETSAEATPVACGSSDTPTVTTLGSPNFYIDSGITPKLDANYGGYTVRAGTTAEPNLRIVLSNFTGGVVSLANNQPSDVTLPSLTAGEATTSYFLFKATGPTATAQSHKISLFRGGTYLCERSFTYTRVAETIKALANKVDSVTSSTNGAVSIGTELVVTVEGRTGTLGAGPTYDPGILSYAPAAMSDFPANAWRLERTTMTISPDGVAAQTTFTNRLYLSGASGPDRPYTARYTFRAIDATTQQTAVKPIQYIASGTQVKHTDLAGSVTGDIPPISDTSLLSMTKSVQAVSRSFMSGTQTFEPISGNATGGTVRYTITVSNSGGTSGTLDRIVDTMDAGLDFVTGTATISGRARTPTVSGRDLIFYGPITIPAGSSVNVVYDVTVQNVVGSYRNSVVGWFGNARIDGSTSINQQNPATTTVVVAPAYGPLQANPYITSTSPATTAAVTAPKTMTLRQILGDSLFNSQPNLTLTIVRQPNGGTAEVLTQLSASDGPRILYTPDGVFGGSDVFEYRISNGFTTATSTITVNVPKAIYDQYVFAEDNAVTQTFTVPVDQGLITGNAGQGTDICPTTPCVIKSISSTLGTFTLTPTTGAKEGAFTFSISKSSIPSDGTINFTYILKDSANNEAGGTGRIVINNLGPDRAFTPYKTVVPLDVLANDTARTSINSTSNVIGGTATISNADSAVSRTHVKFTPTAGFVGIGQFDYTVSSRTSSARVLVAPPAATYQTTINTSVTNKTIGNTAFIDLFGSLVSPQTSNYRCTSCSYAITTAPLKGSVSFTNPANGTFTYTPSTGSTGSDTFTYSLTEPTGISVTSTVTIQIGPDAVDDLGISVLAKNTVSFDVLTNDNCPTTCTVQVLSNPSSGTLTQTTSGGGAFTYSNSSAIGTFTFQYRVTSTQTGSLSDTATVEIRVEGAQNDSGETSPGVPLTMNIRANDPCDDCSLGTVSQPTIGTVNVNTNGTVTYIPPSTFSGTATFTYTVTKGGNSTSATVTVIVNPDAKNDAIAVLPSSTNTLDVLHNDICADCIISARTVPDGGTATITADGFGITYVSPSSGGPFTFTYTITDSRNRSDTATVTITIATGPTANDDSATTFAGQAVSISTSTNDTCTNAPCSIEIASDPSNGVASVSVSGNYVITYVPNPSFSGIDTFTYTLVTSFGLRDTATVTVTVRPIANDDQAVTGTNVPTSINVLANDSCTSCDVTIVTQPQLGGTISSVSGGTVTFSSASANTYTFSYKVVNNSIQTAGFTTESQATANVTVVVGDASPDEASTPFATTKDINVIANDTCASAGCVATSVNTSGGPTNDSASILPGGTAIRYTPDPTFSGIVTFSYTATYGSNTATAMVTVLVGPQTLSLLTDKNTAVSGNLFSGASGISCTGCVITFKSFVEPVSPFRPGQGDILLEQNGAYLYTPKDNFLGTDYPITYTVTYTNSLSSPQISQDGIINVTVDSLTPSLTLTKTGQLNDGADDIVNIGDYIDYSFAVENTYDRTLTNIVVTDDKIDNDSVNIDCPSGGTTNVISSLATGSSVTCVSRYYLTQSDIDSGRITNIAMASGVGFVESIQQNAPASDTDSLTINLTRTASMTIVKSAGAVVRNASDLTRDKAGDTITYSYRVTNTGNVTLTNLTVVDDKIDNDAANIDCPSGGTSNVISTLAPTDSVTCVATYTLTSTDITTQSVTNTATVTGTPPSGASDPAPASSAITVLLNQPISLEIDKTMASRTDPDANGIDPGDVVTYSFRVTNTSTSATLTNITLVDNKISSGITCTGGSGATITSLAPAAFTTCTATYTVAQADVDAGAIINTASVSSNYAQQGGVVSTITASDTNTISVTQTPGLSITNTFSSLTNSTIAPDSQTDAGDKANFTYVVTNSGNVTLTSILVIGTGSTTVDCGSGATISTLAPGGTTTCTAVHIITQDHLNAAQVSNQGTAGASFTKRGDSSATALSVSATANTSLTQTPSIGITNSGVINTGVDNRSDEGDEALFTYVITNTGNVSLTAISITSSLGTVDCDAGSGTSTTVATLAPSSTATCESTHALTQTEINTGQITDTAGASSVFTRANSTTTTVSDTDPAILNIDQSFDVTISNTFELFSQTEVLPNNRVDAGDLGTFKYIVHNTGNVTLTSLQLSTNIGTVDCDPSDNTSTTISSLTPGNTYTCYTTVTVTQAHIDAEEVANTGQVVASYTYRGSSTPTTATRSSTATEAIGTSPSVEITTTGVLNPPASPNAPNDVLTYTYTVLNVGNTTLSNIDVTVENDSNDTTDNSIADSVIDCGGGTTNRITSLAPGASTTCTAPYPITQDDITRGFVRNNVQASTAAATDTNQYDKPINQHADLEVTTTARPLVDNTSTGPSDGDTIVYDIVVRNSGNVPLTSIVVSIPGLTIDCSPISSLAPGDSSSCVSSSYSLISTDISTGLVTKSATASTTFTYFGASQTTAVTDSDPATTYLAPASLSMNKTAQRNNSVVAPNNRTDAGDEITYTFTVVNDGDVNLVNVEITDPLIDEDDISCDGNATHIISALASGETKTCTATYIITQPNIDAGFVSNTASAASGTATDTDTITTTFTQEPSLTVVKSGVLDDTVVSPDDATDIGDTITYQYLITNTGNVTLSNLVVTDDKIANDALILCPRVTGTNNTITSLAPNVSITCEVVYTVTSGDVGVGVVQNSVIVEATAPQGTPITPATDVIDVRLTPPPDTPINNDLFPDVDANDDAVSAPMGAIVDIDVTSNDGGAPVILVSASAPTNGTTEVRDGLVRLTPDIEYTGSITFNYVITDGFSVDTATVTVSMTENSIKPNPEIFLDMNANGRRDSGEPGVKNVDISLQLESRAVMSARSGSAATMVSSNSVNSRLLTSGIFRSSVRSFAASLPNYSCSTLNSGFCQPPRLPIGTYKVRANFVPANFGLTTTADTDGILDLESRSIPAGTAMSDVQFGVAGLGTIQGHTYVDRDKNDRFNLRSDRPLPNSVIEIVWAGIDGQLGTADDVVLTTTTDANGWYSMARIPAGDYQIRAASADTTVVLSAKVNAILRNSGAETVDFRVTENNNLPSTGSHTRALLQWTLVWTLAGIAMLSLSRRRVREN